MEIQADELHEQHETKLIEAMDYETVLFVLKQEIQKHKHKLH